MDDRGHSNSLRMWRELGNHLLVVQPFMDSGIVRGFKSPGHAQRFLSTFGVIASFFRPGGICSRLGIIERS